MIFGKIDIVHFFSLIIIMLAENGNAKNPELSVRPFVYSTLYTDSKKKTPGKPLFLSLTWFSVENWYVNGIILDDLLPYQVRFSR